MRHQNPRIIEETVIPARKLAPLEASPLKGRAPRSVFLSAFVVIFFTSLSAAHSVGFVPNYIDGSNIDSLALSDLPQLGPNRQVSPVSSLGTSLPERIKIPAIDLDLLVQNPNTRNIGSLDLFLKNGPARYVDSAKLGEKGNMIIFAHSSNLPIVHNKMYQAFNKIPKLRAGDTIVIQGGGADYSYRVTSIRRVDASDTTIDMSSANGTKLTLVTCDTFTGKSARFVLEADFVGVHAL